MIEQRDYSVLVKSKCPASAVVVESPATWADMQSSIGPVTWQWQLWLANGILTMLAGAPGDGKSMIALKIAGSCTRQDPLPDGSPYQGQAGAVVWCEAEAAQAVNLARARAWGLPLDQILTPFSDPLTDVQLDDPAHQTAITNAMRRADVRLMIVDSLRGAHRRDENSSETIKVVKFLAELARDSCRPVLLIHHLRKRGLMDSGDGITLDRLRGSSALVQTARVVWAIDTPDPAHVERKRLSVIKSNLAKFPEAVGFSIAEDGITFCDAPKLPKQETVEDRACDLLNSLLAHGQKSVKEIQEEFRGAGISEFAMKRGKERLHLVSVREREGWYWSIAARE